MEFSFHQIESAAYVAGAIAFAWVVMVSRFDVHRRLSVVGTAFLTLTLLHGVSAIPYVMGVIPSDTYNPPTPLSRYFVPVLSISFVCFALGAWTTGSLLNFNLRNMQQEYFSSLPSRGRLNAYMFLLLSAGIIVLAVLFAYGAGKPGFVALVDDFRNGRILKEHRQDFYESNPYAWAGAFATGVVGPLVLLTSINLARGTKSAAFRVYLVGLFCLLALAGTSGLHKAPLPLLVLFIAMNWHFSRVSTREQQTGGKIWLIGAVVMGTIVTGGYLLTYDLDLSEAVLSTVSRIFLSPQACLNRYLFVYPDIVPHANGLGIGLIAKIAGDHNFVSPAVVVGSVVSTSEFRISSNAFWAADLWANFGYLGVAIGSLAVGAIMVFLDWWSLRRPRTAANMAEYAFLVTVGLRVLNASIFTGLLSGGLLFAPVYALAVQMTLIRRQQTTRPARSQGADSPGEAARHAAVESGP